MAIYTSTENINGVTVKINTSIGDNYRGDSNVKKEFSAGKPLGITIHNTNGPPSVRSAEAYVNFYPSFTNSIPHYYIDDHEAWQIIALNKRGSHAGGGPSGNTGSKGNANTIGIECICHGDTGRYYHEWSEKAMDLTAKITAFLMKKFNFTFDNLFTHNYWRKGGNPIIDSNGNLAIRDDNDRKKITLDGRGDSKYCPVYIMATHPGGWEDFLKMIKNYYDGGTSLIVKKPYFIHPFNLQGNIEPKILEENGHNKIFFQENNKSVYSMTGGVVKKVEENSCLILSNDDGAKKFLNKDLYINYEMEKILVSKDQTIQKGLKIGETGSQGTLKIYFSDNNDIDIYIRNEKVCSEVEKYKKDTIQTLDNRLLTPWDNYCLCTFSNDYQNQQVSGIDPNKVTESNNITQGSTSSDKLRINCTDEWIQMLVGVVAQECQWAGLGVAQAVLIVARNWAYAEGGGSLSGKTNPAERRILNWGHGLSPSQLLNRYQSWKDREIEGINTEQFVRMIMSGQHYDFAEKWNGKNTDGTIGIQYYNGRGPADIEDITGFPGSNTSYKSKWICHIYFGNRFTDWSFRNFGNITKPSVLLGLQ